ncbi:MAG: sigma-70 family RNA polymerase sigma factor [Prevotella sp.]
MEDKKKNLDKLVTDNMGLVVAVAKRYRDKGVEMDDLVSEGYVGLMKAAGNFDAAKGGFAAFAIPIIEKFMEQALQQQSLVKPAASRSSVAGTGRKGKSLSMDAPLGGRENVNLMSFMADTNVPDADFLLYRNAVNDQLTAAMATLPERERVVMTRFYGIGAEKITLAEIASEMGLKRERVRQIRDKALRKVRKFVRQSGK